MTDWTPDPWESAALSMTVARLTCTTLPLDLSGAWAAGVDVVYVDSARALTPPTPSALFVGELRELDGVLADVIPTGPAVTHHQGEPAEVSRYELGGRYERDPRLRPLASQVYRRWVADAAADPDREVHLLDADAGLLVLHWRHGVMRIELIGVARDHRGRGLGGALMQVAVDRAGAHGCARLRVGGYTHNRAAMRLYERAGLRECARTWRYHLHRADQPGLLTDAARPPLDRRTS